MTEAATDRLLAAVAMLAGGAIVGSLFLPWYRYESPEGHTFNAKGWVAFTNLDVTLVVCAALLGGLALLGRPGRSKAATWAIAGIAGLVCVLVVQRLIWRPYAESFEQVIPHVGAGIALLASVAVLAVVVRHREVR